MTDPAIVLLSADHADILEEQLWRSTREHDVRVATTSVQEAKLVVPEPRDEGNFPCLDANVDVRS